MLEKREMNVCIAMLAALGTLATSSLAFADDREPGAVVEMHEACGVGHSLGGPGPVITFLTLYENGEVEYSLAANHKFRVSRRPEDVAAFCRSLIVPLSDATRSLERETENQDDTEVFYVSLPERPSSFPRWKFREIQTTGTPPEQITEDALSEQVKTLLRDIDLRAIAMFGKRYEFRLLRQETE
jgi:hypothetical protein